ncbi:MAG: hypothetical protein ABI947_11930 [Chloroflexota bacterium]
MTRLFPYQRLIVNMKQGLPEGAIGYMTKEKAYEELKKRTQQDFGYDVTAWGKWLKSNNKR